MCKLARTLRRVVLAELVFYAALAAGVSLAAGWERALAAVLGAAFILRAVPILLSYAIAAVYASPVPRDERVGPIRLLGAMLAEIGVAAFLFSVLMPFPRKVRAAPSGGGRPPIILVHAYLCSGGSWWSLRRRLAGQGYDLFAVELDPHWDLDRYAPVIAQQVAEVRARTGAGKVVLIGHSMGGLAIRAYLRACGALYVERVITLGSPHHGSVLARLAPDACGRQMHPGSAWLHQLEVSERGTFPVPFTSIYSRHDNFVAPQDSARLPGASNVALSGVGHLTLLFSRRAYQAVAQALAARPVRSESHASAG